MDNKKIKIVFVINNFLVGGVERLLFDIIRFLDKGKCDIKIVTVLGFGPLEKSFRELGIPIYSAGLSTTFSSKLPAKISWLLTSLITLTRVILFLIKNKPDVVVSSLFQGDIVGMTAAKIAGVRKRILIQHDVVRFNRKIISFVKREFALKSATHIVAVSETVKEFLVEYFGVKHDKVITIFNAIDYERFKGGIKRASNLDAPIIGVLGRLEEVKGHIYMLKALEILKKEYGLSPMTLFAGDGTLRGTLENYVAEHNLDSVKFIGHVSDVPNFLLRIDILVIPSIHEGFGLVVLEGSVSGKAVIASDIEVMRELIKNGENGILFESESADSLANILYKILIDKKMLEKLQGASLLFAEQNRERFDVREASRIYQNLFLSSA